MAAELTATIGLQMAMNAVQPVVRLRSAALTVRTLIL
jgi:hypothetical protein